jgi:phage gp29-like protein
MATPTSRKIQKPKPANKEPLTAGQHNQSGDEPSVLAPSTFFAGAGTQSTRLRSFDRWRERYNPLRGLSVGRAITMLEQQQRGEFADPCWAYFFIECTDADLFALCERRESALMELDWNISPVSVKWRKNDPKFDKALADEQIACLGERYDAIDNLYEAIRHMSTASFRAFAHCEKYRDASGEINHLEPVDQWNMVRDLLNGPWRYNPEAISCTYAGLSPDLNVNPDDFLIVESRRHIDRLGMIKFIRSNLSEKDWDAFMEIYGISSGVVIGPPNVPQGKEGEYTAAAQNIAEGGSGYLPNGSLYVPNNMPRGDNLFRPRLDFLTEKLILAGTGGLLTMLTAPGSGTLAGSAHQEAFDQIARGEARKISAKFQKDIDAEVLDKNFPGKPHLASFAVAANDELDPDKIVDHALKLRQAGYKMSVAQLTEKTGYILTEGPIEKIDVRSQQDDPNLLAKDEDDVPSVKNRATTPGAKRGPDAAVMGKLLARGRLIFGQALADDLRPLREALAEVLGSDDAQIATRAQALYDAMPGLADEIIGANGSTDAMEKILGAAAANGLQAAPAPKSKPRKSSKK